MKKPIFIIISSFAVALLVLVIVVVYPAVKNYREQKRINTFTDYNADEIAVIISRLPFESDRYTIDFDFQLNGLVITPKISYDPTLPLADQIESQWEAYEQYSLEGVARLIDEGVRIDSFYLYFWGQESWPFDKSIDY